MFANSFLQEATICTGEEAATHFPTFGNSIDNAPSTVNANYETAAALNARMQESKRLIEDQNS